MEYHTMMLEQQNELRRRAGGVCELTSALVLLNKLSRVHAVEALVDWCCAVSGTRPWLLLYPCAGRVANRRPRRKLWRRVGPRVDGHAAIIIRRLWLEAFEAR